jgi:hypothetical protein
MVFHYTDAGQTPITILRREVKAGEEVSPPQGNWTGTAALLPPPDLHGR